MNEDFGNDRNQILQSDVSLALQPSLRTRDISQLSLVRVRFNALPNLPTQVILDSCGPGGVQQDSVRLTRYCLMSTWLQASS
jgi:hypothetical protein